MDSVTISALRVFPELLGQYFKVIPERAWHWKPESWEGIPSESLNAIEQICHIRDVEVAGYHVRFRRMLDETEPTLDSLDGYRLVEENKYAQSDPKAVLAEIHSARIQTMKLVESFTEDQLSRAGYFEGYGCLSIKSLVHYLCSHDQQHLSGLQWLLGKIESNG